MSGSEGREGVGYGEEKEGKKEKDEKEDGKEGKEGMRKDKGVGDGKK